MSKLMKRVPIILLFIVFANLISVHITYAESFYSNLHGFSIDIPDDWSKLKPTKSWTLVAYGKHGSGENLNINVLDARDLISIKQVPLKQLFHPWFEHIEIHKKYYQKRSDIDFFECTYTIKNGKLKQRTEGQYRLKYFLVAWISNEKQYTLTFADSETNFDANLPLFIKISDSIKFTRESSVKMPKKEGSKTESFIAILIWIGIIGTFIGWIWSIIFAWRIHWGWAVLMLIWFPLSLIILPILALKYWGRIKKPFIVYWSGVVFLVIVITIAILTE